MRTLLPRPQAFRVRVSAAVFALPRARMPFGVSAFVSCGRAALAGFLLLGCSLLLAAAVPARAAGEPPALQAIESLDVARYLGRWYEVAKFPNRFQRKCVSDTSARYAALPDGRLRVINRCRVESGAMEEARGVARQTGSATSPRLEVRFAPDWLAFLPFVWGNYWVIDLDPDYRLVAISEPSREYLWILARSPRVDPLQYAQLLERLKRQGLDIDRLETSRHTDRPDGD